MRRGTNLVDCQWQASRRAFLGIKFHIDLESIRGLSLAYDQESDRVIALNTDGETWAYQVEGNRWERMGPTPTPRGRCGHAMAYSSAADKIVLFGGIIDHARV